MKYLIATCFLLLLLDAVMAQSTYVPGGTVISSGNSNMGIGTSAPSAKFHLQQSGNSWGDGIRLSLGGNNWDIVSDNNGDRLLISKNQTGTNGLSLINGNLGIGHSSPANKIQVGSNPQGWSGNDLVLSNSTGSLAIHNQADQTYLYGTNHIAIRPGFGLMSIFASSSGKVGIGHSSPQKSLDVKTGANDYATIGETLAIGQWSGLHFGYKENNDLYRKSAIVFERTDNAANGKIHLLNNNVGSQSATLADARLTIDVSGNVGVGNASPQGLLHVNTVRPVIIKNNGGNGIYGSEIGFNAILNTSVVPNKFKKLGGTSQNGGAAIAVDYSGNMFFQMYDAATLAESETNYNPQVAFLSNGAVGIGTTNTYTYKLAVAGKTITEEVVVKLQGNWPDYVFDPEYKLPSLLEVEKFIKANKHLPDVPTAEKVKEDGLSVGEMNAILLKKVEELTLYVIELKKRDEALQSEIETLKKK